MVEDSPSSDGKIIFTGHRGCGKSTLLAEFGRRLADRYFVVSFSISDTIEMSDVNHINILFAIAVNLMEEAEKNQIKISNTDVAKSLNYLAVLYSFQGRYSEAEPLLQQALALKKRLLGDNHPHVASSLNNLAVLYRSQGRYQEAEPFYQQALALRKRLLENNHPDVAQSLNNLALLYHSQGRYEEAETLYLQALEISDRTLGLNHPQPINIRKNLEELRAKISVFNTYPTADSTQSKER